MRVSWRRAVSVAVQMRTLDHADATAVGMAPSARDLDSPQLGPLSMHLRRRGALVSLSTLLGARQTCARARRRGRPFRLITPYFPATAKAPGGFLGRNLPERLHPFPVRFRVRYDPISAATKRLMSATFTTPSWFMSALQ